MIQGNYTKPLPEDGWPFRMAFAIGTLAFFVNRSAGLLFSDLVVFVVSGTCAFLAAVLWPVFVSVRSHERSDKPLVKFSDEPQLRQSFCPCCGRPIE